MTLSTISIIVKGKVQGVFYRQTAKETAKKLGVTGWVRNNDDGNVEIIATGNEQQLDRYLEWCSQGPPRAEVSSVETSTVSLQHFTDFIIDRK
jgi:acylphosphatase